MHRTFPDFQMEGKVQVSRQRLNNLVRLALITEAESFNRRALILSRPIPLFVLSSFS